MKICYGNRSYFGLSDYKAGLKKMAEHGWTGLNFENLEPGDSELYKMDAESRYKILKDIREEAEKNGITVELVHSLWPFDDKTESGRAQTVEIFKETIKCSSILGSKNVVVHPFMPFGWHIGEPYDEIYRLNREMFISLLPTAHKYDVNVCMENLPMTHINISKISEVKKLVREIDDEKLRICLDTGHVNVFDMDIYEAIKVGGDDIVALHVHDNKKNKDLHLPPFLGTVKWDGFIKGLKEIDYRGAMTLETVTPLTMPEPMRSMQQKSLAASAKYFADAITKND